MRGRRFFLDLPLNFQWNTWGFLKWRIPRTMGFTTSLRTKCTLLWMILGVAPWLRTPSPAISQPPMAALLFVRYWEIPLASHMWIRTRNSVFTTTKNGTWPSKDVDDQEIYRGAGVTRCSVTIYIYIYILYIYISVLWRGIRIRPSHIPWASHGQSSFCFKCQHVALQI